jgi:SAM-dependent methyltransferase
VDGRAPPFGGQAFDLVTSTVSLHHWGDQLAGLAEVGRVLAPGGVFVLTDLHAVGYLRVVYALGRRRGRMHTKRELIGMLGEAGLRVSDWAPIFDLDVLLPLRSPQPTADRSGAAGHRRGRPEAAVTRRP